MIKYLLWHQWLRFKRSPSYGRELGISIFIWVVSFFAFLSFVVLAFALPRFIAELPGVTNPVSTINLGLVYFFSAELLMRYFLQSVPALDVQPYLGLPIKRIQVSIFLIGKSLVSIFNILSLLLALPFAVQVLTPQFGTAGTTAWLLCIFCISLCLHFFNILFKKKLENLPAVWAVLIVIVSGNYFLYTYFQVDLFTPLASALTSVLYYPVLATVPLILAAGFTFVTIRFFNKSLYIEEMRTNTEVHSESYSEMFGFLGRSSLLNTLILQEIRLILRHKRSRSVLIVSVFFVTYGLIFLRGGSNDLEWHVFVGIFISGAFTINYGQFFWSWATNQLDFFMTKPIAFQTWIRSRYRILAIASLATALMAIPYIYFGWEVMLAIIAAWFYNLGINIPIMMRMAMWSPKAIDLNKNAFMNYEGTGAAQWVMALPLMVGPYVFYLPAKILFGHVEGLCSIAVFGLIGFALRDYFLRLITQKFQALKYKLNQDLTL